MPSGFHRLRPKRRRTDRPGTDSSVSYIPADDGGCQRRTFQPAVVYDGDTPVEYASVPLTCYEGKGYRRETFESISTLLENYYASRDTITRIRQKSSDLRRIVQTALERSCKKYDLQLKQLKDTEKREKYRIYGELLNTYGYELKGGEKSFKCINYYDNEEITIH